MQTRIFTYIILVLCIRHYSYITTILTVEVYDCMFMHNYVCYCIFLHGILYCTLSTNFIINK